MLNKAISGASKLMASLAIFAAIALAVIPLRFIDYSWARWRPATCMPSGCFCEAVGSSLVRQPANAYSNLGYIFVGVIVLGLARTGSLATTGAPNIMLSHRGYLVLYGLAVFSIGAGSLFYHASLTFAGQWFDLMGMYLFATFVLVYNASRLRRLPPAAFVVVYLVLNISLGAVLAIIPSIRIRIFSALIGAGLGIEVAVLFVRRPSIRLRYLVGALASFALAYLIWTLDERRLLCAPGSLLQGHATWHLLTALSTAFTFRYYLSDGIRLE